MPVIPPVPPYTWTTNDKRKILVTDMEPGHIVNTIRHLENRQLEAQIFLEGYFSQMESSGNPELQQEKTFVGMVREVLEATHGRDLWIDVLRNELVRRAQENGLRIRNLDEETRKRNRQWARGFRA